MWQCNECSLYNKPDQNRCQACFTYYNAFKNNVNDDDNKNDNDNNDDKLKLKAKELGEILISDKSTIAEKMRTCFLLKQLNTNEAIDNLNKGFKSNSALLKHEIAYVMGQMRNKYAVPYLESVLRDKNQEPITRHEAGEALAAIGEQNSRSILEEFAKDECVEVAETCQLALDSLNWALENDKKIEVSQSNSVDPAPSINNNKKKLTEDQLEILYLNENESLFKRYRAMFALRDINSKKAVQVLCKGFNDKSALFKHEIAFVLGQMMNKEAVSYLQDILSKKDEHCMVRHECAEALGSIAGHDCVSCLKEYLQDKEQVVSQSCEVALDMYEYWNNDEIDNVYD